MRRFDEVIGALRACGADVVLFHWVDLSRRLPGRRVIVPRVELMNRLVAETGERHGAPRVAAAVADHPAAPGRSW